MKIGGRKNDGAWYRTNKYIRKLVNLNPATAQALRAAIVALPTIDPFVGDLQDLANQVEQGGEANQVITADAIANAYTTRGIPRCVWNGKLSYDTYTKEGDGPTAKWVPDHPDNIRLFSVDLRELLKRFMFGNRQVLDVLNVATRQQGNPGGIADAEKGD